MNIDKTYKYVLKNLKYSKKSRKCLFLNFKKWYFFYFVEKIIGQIMIKCPKITKKPHGSKFRKKCDFTGFPQKMHFLIIYNFTSYSFD
jgi:hypothetical protein